MSAFWDYELFLGWFPLLLQRSSTLLGVHEVHAGARYTSALLLSCSPRVWGTKKAKGRERFVFFWLLLGSGRSLFLVRGEKRGKEMIIIGFLLLPSLLGFALDRDWKVCEILFEPRGLVHRLLFYT